MVLMTGFGYDPGHSIVKARQAGLQAVLYKPFRLDQLLETVEQIVTEHRRPRLPLAAHRRGFRWLLISPPMIYLALAPAAVGHVIFWAAMVNRLHGWRSSAAGSIGMMLACAARHGWLAAGDRLYLLDAQARRRFRFAARHVASARHRLDLCLSLRCWCAVLRLRTASASAPSGATRRAGIESHVTRRFAAPPPSPLTAPGIPRLARPHSRQPVARLARARKTITLPRLAAGRRLRIVHITDLHMSGRIAKQYFDRSSPR